MCCYGIAHTPLSLSIVGSTLHAPNNLHQEQPDHFLLGLHCCRRERGGSFPPALVGSSTEHMGPYADLDVVVVCVARLSLNAAFVLSGQCFLM